MGIRNLARAALIGTAAIALGSLPAAAQTVTFSTTGAFSGGSCTATSCPVGDFTLTYIGQPSTSYGAPTNVDLGNFQVSCATPPCTNGSAIAAGSTFTLTITQTAPSGGTGSFVGSLSGTLSWNPAGSTLFWKPTTGTVVIGSTSYALIESDAGGGTLGINISAATSGTNGTACGAGITNPNCTDVKAFVVTPEPASLALLATGLIGIIPVVRRRRQN